MSQHVPDDRSSSRLELAHNEDISVAQTPTRVTSNSGLPAVKVPDPDDDGQPEQKVDRFSSLEPYGDLNEAAVSSSCVSIEDDSILPSGIVDIQTPSLVNSQTLPERLRPEPSPSERPLPVSLGKAHFAKSHKISTLTAASFILACFTLPVLIAFLSFLWSHPEGTQAPQAWLNVVLSGWTLKSITITTMILRTAVSVQAA